MELSLWGGIHERSHARLLKVMDRQSGGIGEFVEWNLCFAPSSTFSSNDVYSRLQCEIKDGKPGRWKFVMEDVPEPGGNPQVTARFKQQSGLLESKRDDAASAIAFVESLGYRLTYAYLIHGHRIVLDHTALLSVFLVEPIAPSPTVPDTQTVRDQIAPGIYVVKASIYVQDSSDAVNTTKAADFLKNMANRWRHIVDLKPVERNLLNTKAR
jgi:hypothetical protein